MQVTLPLCILGCFRTWGDSKNPGGDEETYKKQTQSYSA
jgi:hypothetical protein